MANVILKVGLMADRSIDTLVPRIDGATKQAANAATRNMAAAAAASKTALGQVMGLSEAQLKKHLGDLGYSAKVLQTSKAREVKIVEDAEKKKADATARWEKLRQRIIDNSFRWEQAARERDERAAAASVERKARQEQSARARQERMYATIQRNSFRMEQSDRERHDRQVAATERRERAGGIRSRARSFRRAFGAVAGAIPGMPTSLEGAAMLPFTAAFGMGRNMAAGMGVDFDYGSGAGRAINLERMAIRLSNSAYMPGAAGPNGRRQDPRKLMAEAYSIGNELGEDPAEALEGMSKFVAKTGDLASVRPVMRELAMLSKAFGTDLGDMANAAADVALQLGDVKDKGAIIGEVMRNIAAQGKMGAVEVSDLARQMAKVAKGAQFFEGGGAQNVQTFTAMAQMAKAHGGAASPTAAATAVDSWVNQFNKAARLGGMEKLLGKDFIRGEGDKDLYKRPELIIAQGLRKSHGNLEKMGGAWADAQAVKVTRAATFLYREGVHAYKADKQNAGATDEQINEAGVAYYLKKLKELTDATVSEAELMGSLELAQHDMKSEVQRFNNQMTEVSGELAHQFLPVIVGLIPYFKRFGEGLAGAIEGLTGAKHAGESAGAAKTGADIVDVNNKIERVIETGGQMTPEQKQAARDKLNQLREEVDKNIRNTKEAAQPTGMAGEVVGAMDVLAQADRLGRAVYNSLSPADMLSLLAGQGTPVVNPQAFMDTMDEELPSETRKRIGGIEGGWNKRDLEGVTRGLHLLTLVMERVADKKDPAGVTGAPTPGVKAAGRDPGRAKAGPGEILEF